MLNRPPFAELKPSQNPHLSEYRQRPTHKRHARLPFLLLPRPVAGTASCAYSPASRLKNISITIRSLSFIDLSLSFARKVKGPSISAYLFSLTRRFLVPSSSPRRKLSRRPNPGSRDVASAGLSSAATRETVEVRNTKAMLWLGADERMSEHLVLDIGPGCRGQRRQVWEGNRQLRPYMCRHETVGERGQEEE